jgi:lipoate---protein ligase
MWQIINSGSKNAQELMDLDKHFLETLEVPTLHFYRFKGPSLTYGLLMDPKEHLNMEALEQKKINLGKRPTGGGALFHMWDLAFSVIIPLKFISHISSTLDRYLLINKLTEYALEPFLNKTSKKSFLDETPDTTLGERFCMAKPTKYDVMIEGKKCVGAAQRATKKCLLHQATISLCKPDLQLLKEVLLNLDVALKMQEQSFHLCDFLYTDHPQLSKMQEAIEKSLEFTFNQYYKEVFEKKISPEAL